MSWSGFKKNVGRATTQVMMKTGHVERTSDREYEVEERRYRTLESASLRLQKEAKGYLDSLRAMTASQMRIAETIDAFYGDSGATDGVSRSYKQAVEDLDAETVKALDGPYRCVPSDLHEYVKEENDTYDMEELQRIEWEMNQGRAVTYSGVLHADMDGVAELMDYVYRTTVLEPINRFCAYFPDINECIKKRNHKMLDYDSVRARVRKLTEKPDKDPSKLPRTEKEAEMVSLHDFLSSPPSPSRSSTFPRRKSIKRRSGASYVTTGSDSDFGMPSPPKALNGIRQKLGLAPEDVTGLPEEDVSNSPGRSKRTLSLRRSTSIMSRASTLLSPRLGAGPNEAMFQRRDTQLSPCAPYSSFASEPAQSKRSHDLDQSRFFTSMPAQRSPSLFSTTSTIQQDQPRKSTGSGSRSISASTRGGGGGTWHSSSFSFHPSITSSSGNPWFAPDELEDLMRPAKAAYEQLNEQLTTELPQLIDLRVPYLDPSFEALVKIQLRFCAEAYSRMAQVQQYLDASTRDQYASGDLDARVEDVLGQIRELSIAGTV